MTALVYRVYVAACYVGRNEANRKVPPSGKIRGFINVKSTYSNTNSDNEEADNEHPYANARVSTPEHFWHNGNAAI